MDRRELLKSLLVGTFSGGLVLKEWAREGPSKSDSGKLDINLDQTWDYGRTKEEKARDKRLMSQQFFTESELETIAVLCDLILPASSTAGSATDAGVPEFIEFISKDLPYHQTPLRGGLMWLDNRSNKLFGKPFAKVSDKQRRQLLDEIAYPDKAKAEVEQGVHFFNLIRNLTLTGYYTTEMGINDLGYKGNAPNVWDGVPKEVLDDHDVDYEQEWLDKCIDQDTRTEIAKWDEDGNLIN